MRFVTAGCKPVKQERQTKSTNIRAALTVGTIPRYSENGVSFTIFMPNRALTYSPMHILPTSSSKSAPNALATVWCTFSRTDLPKVLRRSERVSLFDILKSSPALATVLCAFCRQLSEIETGTLFQRPLEPHFLKNTGFRAR